MSQISARIRNGAFLLAGSASGNLLRFSLAMLLAGGVAVVAAQPKVDRPKGLTEVEMVAVMEAHYRSAIASHDALIRGDLDTLRSRAGELVTQPLPPAAPESWKPHDAQLRKAAAGIAAVFNLEEAGPAMAAVAEACGACHAALQVKQIYFWPAPPDADEKLRTAMHTHQWASERLWEGVTGPFDEAWQRGAKALAEAKLFKDDAEVTLREREAALRNMGNAAMEAAGLHERALVYGRLLATCAECHLAAGIEIPQNKSTL